ncbi:hypothetical protein HZ989_08580 [Brevundimonas sp. AJA228-03]|uniref:hypothetical protein n=1 Tax=Brevundimonas sp. AJA228-03 TaxID=2752515 RepID=UPI001AE07FD1|nr:hypothetical protein [Brevundimonas sp. AJA228-03]QTN18344.1 hypothetical protein HZ989_08580 [Brevundimonas sp. AJA228-03]
MILSKTGVSRWALVFGVKALLDRIFAITSTNHVLLFGSREAFIGPEITHSV